MKDFFWACLSLGATPPTQQLANPAHGCKQSAMYIAQIGSIPLIKTHNVLQYVHCSNPSGPPFEAMKTVFRPSTVPSSDSGISEVKGNGGLTHKSVEFRASKNNLRLDTKLVLLLSINQVYIYIYSYI